MSKVGPENKVGSGKEVGPPINIYIYVYIHIYIYIGNQIKSVKHNSTKISPDLRS